MEDDSSKEIATNIVNTVLTGDQQFWLLIANFSAILLVKLSLIFVAAMTIYLGYKLLVQGVKGEFKFNTEMQGVKADLVSASPGTFFVLLGVIVLITAIQTKYSIPIGQKASNTTATKNSEQKTEVQSEWLSKDDPFSKDSGG
jgi:hypothetical protein